MRHRRRHPACLAAGIAMLWVTATYAQEEASEQPEPSDQAGEQAAPSGTYIDGVFVENYVYQPKFISPEELKKLLDAKSKDIVVVDTAAALVFEEQHIPGAVNLPYAPSLPQPVTLSRTKTLVIYCACNAEEESIDTAKKLVELGYQNIKVLKGGWLKWLDMDYETAGTDAKGAGTDAKG